MLRRYAVVVALLGLSFAAHAQPATTFGFEFRPAAKVVQGTDTLRQAWAGGLNTPQFSSIDLNNDGQNDLFAFDRESYRIYTFLNVANPAGGRQWQYAPQYASLFPDDLSNWALLRDYDCDGRPDLFTNYSSDVRVFRNVAGPNGLPNFTLATNQVLFTYGGGTANLTVGGYNMPDIKDVNGDGKLDIVTYEFSGATVMELYLNTSPGSCGGALTFNLASSFWGLIESCASCASYRQSGQSCVTVSRQPNHTPGHNILLLDLDGDGDQDVLDGRDGCPELVRLMNQGNSQTANFPTAAATTNFPAGSPARANGFPAAYSLDVNFDGRPDLVTAPNMLDNLADRASLRNSIQIYTNSASSGPPVFTFQPGGFLQKDMIDVSEGAAPTFGDVSGDGLPDMLIGNLGDNVNGVYRATIAYYRNVGTSTRPIFSLVTDDYLGLSARSYEGIKPSLVDLNRDSRLDLAFSVWTAGSNEIQYVLNTAAAGQPAAFNVATINNFKGQGPAGSGILPYARGDKACFVDVDNDGYVDLLVGTDESREPGMSLRYFRNRGTGLLENAFVLVDNDYGRIRANGLRPKNLSPTVADFDGDGHLDLLTADHTGTLRMFTNFRAQSNVFLERTDLIYNSVSGQFEGTALGRGPAIHTNLAAADINNDGAPELFLGMQAGGVMSYGTRNRFASSTRSEAARALVLTVYPNPATTTIAVETAAPTRVSLLDLTGRTLRAGGTLARRHSLEVSGLAAGIYLVRAEAADGTAAVQRLMVR